MLPISFSDSIKLFIWLTKGSAQTEQMAAILTLAMLIPSFFRVSCTARMVAEVTSEQSDR